MESHRIMTESQEKELKFITKIIVRIFPLSCMYYVDDEFKKSFVRIPEFLFILGGIREFIFECEFSFTFFVACVLWFSDPLPGDLNLRNSVAKIYIYIVCALMAVVGILDICMRIYREKHLGRYRELHREPLSEKEPTEMKEVVDKKSD